MNFQIFLSPFIFIFLITSQLSAQKADELYRSSCAATEQASYQKALTLINDAIALDSSNANYFLQRASVQYCLGNYDISIKDCYTVQELKPDLPDVYLLRGKICLVTESYGPGILFFGKVINRSVDNKLLFDAHLNRGKAYIAIKRFGEALADFDAALSIDKTSIEALYSNARAYYYLNQNTKAVEILNQVLLVDPAYAPAFELMGGIRFNENNLKDAAAAYEKYAVLMPGEINTLNTLGGIYLQMNEYDKAFNILNNAMAIDPLNPNTYKIKGQVQIAKGDIEKGCNTLFRAMQMGYFEKYGYDLLDLYLEKCEE